MEVLDAIERISDPVLAGKFNQALRLLRRALALYPPANLAFSFNGGKDSTVLLYLLRAAVAQHRGHSAAPAAAAAAQQPVPALAGVSPSDSLQPAAAALQNGHLLPSEDAAARQQPGAAPSDADAGVSAAAGFRSFFFEYASDFQEVRTFVHASDSLYGLHVEYLKDSDFRRGLDAYLHRFGVAAVILGTRQGDPNAGGQEHFCPSSDGWPPFMRVNPLLEWSYHDVWSFLRATGGTYCSLYDQGYTSLGSQQDTQRNSALLCRDGSYSPAYALLDGTLERAGRSVRQGGPAAGALQAGAACALPLTAAVLVVGDGMLAGRAAQDGTAPFLCEQLHQLGWQVTKVVFLPDAAAADAVGDELRRLSPAAEVVLAVAGPALTCDDALLAWASSALLLGEPLARKSHQDSELSPAVLTAPHLQPEAAPVSSPSHNADNTPGDVGGTTSSVLPVRFHNIYMLPGAPSLLRQRWCALRSVLAAQACGSVKDPLAKPEQVDAAPL